MWLLLRVAVAALSLLSSSSNRVAADCATDCASRYLGTVLPPCLAWCRTNPDLFDPDYPYVFGPLPMRAYPELTGIDADEVADITGTLWARVDATRTKIQFRYAMDNNPEPFFPYFAMHLHEGMLNEEEIGGSVIVSIAGKGDLVGNFGFSFKSWSVVPCSRDCTDGNQALGNCVQPFLGFLCLIYGLTAGYAYFCENGCQGDNRISGNSFLFFPAQTVVPSRACDLDNDNPSNAAQDTWIQGLHSNELSGNPEDEKYSPYSIAASSENFALWCGDAIPFLVDEVLKDGAAGYIALHLNRFATGLPALLYGDVFAQLTDRETGPQSCYIFGDTNHTCADGLGKLPPIGKTD